MEQEQKETNKDSKADTVRTLPLAPEELREITIELRTS